MVCALAGVLPLKLGLDIVALVVAGATKCGLTTPIGWGRIEADRGRQSGVNEASIRHAEEGRATIRFLLFRIEIAARVLTTGKWQDVVAGVRQSSKARTAERSVSAWAFSALAACAPS